MNMQSTDNRYHPAGDVTSFCDAEKGYSEKSGLPRIGGGDADIKNRWKKAKIHVQLVLSRVGDNKASSNGGKL